MEQIEAARLRRNEVKRMNPAKRPTPNQTPYPAKRPTPNQTPYPAKRPTPKPNSLAAAL